MLTKCAVHGEKHVKVGFGWKGSSLFLLTFRCLVNTASSLSRLRLRFSALGRWESNCDEEEEGCSGLLCCDEEEEEGLL